MSLYPQSTSYGQVTYPAPGYPQPHGGGYQYQHAPPPAFPHPAYQMDPGSFRRDYMARLAELHFNSRPMIQNLSMIAQDNSRWAEIVAQCLETHIRRVGPWLKLPAFYVLDAISKNVYEPYARHFAGFIVPLFLEAYQQVDQATRSKMEEMLLTWRTGAPNGKELFGVVPQVGIERGVWGGDSAQPTYPSNFYSGSGQISKAQVLSELEFTLGQKQRAVQANHLDSVSQNHIAVLYQLRTLVENGVSQVELREILNQLRTMVQPPPPPPVPAPTQYHAQPPSFGSQPQYSNPVPQNGFPVAGPSYTRQNAQPYSYDQPKVEPMDASSSVAQLSASSDAGSSNAAAGGLAGLFDRLVKAGFVPASVTPTGADATAKTEESKLEIVDFARQSSRDYRKSILTQKVKLTASDITKRRPEITRLLYDRLPVQCKQCGIRFADDHVGKKTMEDHLDMHFRQNRKANQNVGRGHSRSWFVGVEDWIHDISGDTKGKGRADGSRRLSAKAAAAAEASKRDAELRAQYVVVPPGDEAKPISCPICKETLKSEFLEDDEDWVWKNAIKKDDRVYHATCHAEAVASTNNLAARLRNEVAQRSRSATPEGPSSRSTPPKIAMSGLKTQLRMSPSPSPESRLAGTKRKADSEENTDADGSPATKKLAVETSSTS